MKHFKPVGKPTYKWTNWTKCLVKFRFDYSLEDRKIDICDCENNSVLIKLNCQYGDYDSFRHLTNDLDDFCESSTTVTSRKIAFPNKRFIRDLVDDAYEMLNGNCLVSKINDKITLGLALYYLILSKKSIFPEEYIKDHYALMDFCREKIIGKFNPKMTSGDNFIPFIYLLCHYWKYTFTKYAKYFTDHDPEEEIKKIISGDCASDKLNWGKLNLHRFWEADFWKNDNVWKGKFLILIKDLIGWFGTERYNLPAMNRLINVQKGLEIEQNKKWIERLVINILLWSRKGIPRLFGAIIVGYMSLILQDSAWEFCLDIHWFPAFLIVLLSLFFSWLIILTKINKSVNDTNKVIKRTCKLLRLGIIESLIIGVVLCTLFSGMLTSYSESSKMINIFWLPKVILYSILLVYSSLALFIGVFIQLFWEEKPITEEL